MSKFTLLSLLLAALLITACGGGPATESAAAPPTLDPASDAGQGQVLFRARCATCHTVQGDTVLVGPPLSGIATRAGERVAGESAEDYLHESILFPNAYVVEGFVAGAMQQNFADLLTLEEVNQIVAYLLTLEG